MKHIEDTRFILFLVTFVTCCLLAIVVLVLSDDTEEVTPVVASPIFEEIDTAVVPSSPVHAEPPAATSVSTIIIDEVSPASAVFDEQRDRDIRLLAQLIQAEAGIEDFDGKRLVADVVLNRRDNETDNIFRTLTTIEDVVFYQNAFSSIDDGNFDEAADEISEDCYLAAEMEYDAASGSRLDNRVVYFTAGDYGKYGEHAYQHGRHYFCYE